MGKRDRERRRDAPSDSESSDGGRSRRRKKHKKTDKKSKKASHKKKARHDRDEPPRPDYKVCVRVQKTTSVCPCVRRTLQCFFLVYTAFIAARMLTI